MDVPDENDDADVLRGVKRCLSSDKLHTDIVPKKKGNSYFANRDITASIGHIPNGGEGGHSEPIVGDEGGHSETVVPSRGVKRHLEFDNVNTDCTKRNRHDGSYTDTDGVLGVSCTLEGFSYGENCGFDTCKKTKKSDCVCTCCHADNLNRRACVIFREALYDMSNAQIAHLLRARLKQNNCKELICKKCHTAIENLKGRSATTTSISSHYSMSACENGETGQGSSCITSVSVLSEKMGVGPEMHMPSSEQTSKVTYPSQEQVSTFADNILPLQEDEVSTPDNAFICTCCHVKNPNRRKYVYFSLANYDQNNDVVDRALQYRFSRSYMREVICKKCHNSLKKCMLP